MYERYVMNKDRLLQQIKSEYQTTAKKISVVEGEIKEIGVKLERTEESYILGRISKKKSEQLRTRLLEEKKLILFEFVLLILFNNEIIVSEILKKSQW